MRPRAPSWADNYLERRAITDMSITPQNERSQSETLEAMRVEVARLSERVAALEMALSSRPDAQPELAKTSEISAETLAAISAVLAAYLGVTPRIRQITLLNGATWAQQGRVTIQASHTLTSRHS
jgi:methylmalonyl-CoA carboxyltransferase large subunit